MAHLPITKMELIRTPANGHDDYLYRTALEQPGDTETVYYSLSDTQRCGFEGYPSCAEIQSVIQRRASGWLSNYEDEDGTFIAQVRARGANGRRCGGPDGSFEHPFVVTPDPQ